MAFLIDLFARRIVGWPISCSTTTDFVLDAFEHAPTGRRRDSDAPHCQKTEYVSIWHSERLAKASFAPSVGSRGDSIDCVLAETINGLCKTERIPEMAHVPIDTHIGPSIMNSLVKSPMAKK